MNITEYENKLDTLDRGSRERAMQTAREIKNRASYGCAQWVSEAVKAARAANRAIVRRRKAPHMQPCNCPRCHPTPDYLKG